MSERASALLAERPLAGSNALLTGAAGGICRAVALRLAAAGANLFLIDRDGAGLAQTRELVLAAGGRAEVHEADLADRAQVTGCVGAGVSALGSLDLLINGAGITGPAGSLLDADENAWDLVFAVNTTAPYLLIRRFAAQLIERGVPGRIVNISSSSAHRARMSRPAYGASKAALMQLTRLAAADLGPHGINVNAVAPGLTVTPMVSHVVNSPTFEAKLREGPLSNLLGRVSEPEDIAEAVLFLCLHSSRQITGQTIHVSAGAVI